MALKTDCQISGTVFKTKINPNKINIEIDLPFDLEISEKEAKILEGNIHNVMEIVLKSYFITS